MSESTNATTDSAAEEGKPVVEQQATTPEAPKPQPPAAAPQASKAQVDGLPDDPETLQGIIRDLRKENAATRTNAKQAAAQEARDSLVQELGKALGLVQDGDVAPDVDGLKAAAEKAQSDARAAQVELAVFRAAPAVNGDPAALLDSRAFLMKVADLDPTSGEFQNQITAAITEAVAANPKLSITVQAAGSSSVDHPGGSGEGAVTKEQFAAMTPAAKNELFKTNPTLYRTLTGR